MVAGPGASGRLEAQRQGEMAEAAVLAWIHGPGSGSKAVQCASGRCSVGDVIRRHCRDRDVPVEYFFVTCSGALVSTSDIVQHGAVYSLKPRLRGGKGGFGSMLRALGAQIEKTTNREACRDLSGRRLRDVNHEKAMAEWVKQQAEREAEKEQRRLERLQRKLAEPKHCFTSLDYQQQCHEMAERLEDSVLKGMQAASSKMVSAEISENRKRPNKSETDQGPSVKKGKCFWLGLGGVEPAEGSGSESTDDDDDSPEPPGTSGVSYSAPEISGGSAEMASDHPCSSRRAGVLSTDSASPARPQSPANDPEEEVCKDSCAEPGATSTKEHREGKVVRETGESQEKKEAECHEPMEKDTAGAGLNKDKGTEEVTDGDRDRPATGAPEDGENVPLANLEGSQSGDTALCQEAVDLLTFGSVAELEALGLEKLKRELMALGLKCGGTLQERAARLFSVRGLAKEHIDPALFAKPSKGKKK